LVVAGGGSLLLSFVGGEVGLFYLWTIVRREFLMSGRIDSKGSQALFSLLARSVIQIIAGFTGCLHFRHPFILGGFYFSMSMLWAQVFPFVALYLYKNADGIADNTNDHNDLYFDNNTDGLTDNINNHDDLGEKLQLLLICSFVVWLMLNVAFFCTIDLNYIFTFFSIERGPAWVARRFKEEGAKDFQKFDIIFDTNLDYSEPVHGEVKEWIAANIVEWRAEKPEWFVVEMIPDDFLPKEVFVAEGGARRRRSNFSLREIAGFHVDEASDNNDRRVHPVSG